MKMLYKIQILVKFVKKNEIIFDILTHAFSLVFSKRQ